MDKLTDKLGIHWIYLWYSKAINIQPINFWKQIMQIIDIVYIDQFISWKNW